MTAVIYARYSSDNQREESIEGQIRECNAYAEKNGITVVKHYIDRAISAKTDNRPQFQQMIKDSERKLFDMVLVWKLDRFARNRYDSARYKTQLKKNGVKLMSATEIISDGPEGIILESVLEGYAEYYSADLSEKVIRGMTENALKGKFTGGAVPVGYRIDENQRFQTDPFTAPLIAEAFRMYNEGATMTEVRDWLNEHQVKNPRGGPMSYNTVQHMLKNRRYIGELKYRDILIPDAIPPIVSPELFEDVQIKMAKNKKAPARRKAEDDYLLTTKLFCGYCGSLMFGESGTSRSGDVHRYYKCATVKKRKSCQKKTVRKQWLEDLVIAKTKALIMDDAVIDSIVSSVMELQNKENTNLPLYEKQLRETETGIQNMLNAIQAGILTSSTKERLEALETQKKELEAKIAEERLAKPKLSEDFVRFWLTRFRKLDLSQKEQRQALIDTFINAIYLYDDKVLITFNYKEGTETVSFGEATEAATKEKSSDIDCLGAPRRPQQCGRRFCCAADFSSRKRRAAACRKPTRCGALQHHFSAGAAHPEQGHRAGPAVGPDHRADVALVQVGDAQRPELVHHILAVVGAVAMADEHRAPLRVAGGGLEVLDQSVQAGPAAPDLFHGDEVAVVVHMEHRLDAQQSAGHRRRAGQPPAPLEEHQVVHREPGADGGRQLPGVVQRLVKAGPCLPLAGYQIGKQPLAHAGLFGVHTGDAAAGELFLQHFGGHAAGLIGPRQPAGKGQVQNILPSCQHRGERILVIGQGHLAGGAGTARPQLFVIVVGADLPPVGPVAVGLPVQVEAHGQDPQLRLLDEGRGQVAGRLGKNDIRLHLIRTPFRSKGTFSILIPSRK